MHKLGQKTDISHNEIMLPPGARLQLEYEQRVKTNIEKQQKIDEYNQSLRTISDFFNTKEYAGNTIIVRLFKNDYLDKSTIQDIANITDKDIITVLPTAKTELESEGGKLDLIDNPLNYKLQGVICAMSNIVKEKSKESLGFELNIGDIVEFSSYSDLQMYYPDKSKIDNKIAANDVIRGINPYPNFEGYFKASPYNIESKLKS